MKKVELQLEELTCPSCIKKIEYTLRSIDGISGAKVLFNSSKVKADFDESQINEQEIEQAVSRLGYEVLKTKVS